MVVDVKSFRERLRHQVWKLMDERGISRFPKPVSGRIPNFVGAEVAASRLIQSDVFKEASVIKVNPDSPQRPVREAVLRAGKTLIMPTPRIAGGFLLINPRKLPPSTYSTASSISGAFKYGSSVEPEDLPEIELVVVGSTVVSVYGERLGKGEGYSELEYGILVEYGRLNPNVPIVTTVHDVQVIGNHIPLEPWDFTLDYIFTPSRVIKVAGDRVRPRGILWEYLSDDKISSIPILQKLRLSKKVA